MDQNLSRKNSVSKNIYDHYISTSCLKTCPKVSPPRKIGHTVAAPKEGAAAKQRLSFINPLEPLGGLAPGDVG